ncbi:DUF7666 domain-containing protein [Serratia marcescens]|uniref:DUF7666 domain-containing protein n=1 Tax=Serratia marcescens TaxID=615 RepID=UPI002766ACC8|nr:hypothetical protein [Serratia marcescens]MDP8626932.1 hypothetical protein [Serratia marcescens]MDP8676366.1 hypothetical protein [Serratia marcescens]MDP8691369.1 hypothetical protein [Serratia marcescens]MDP8701026.1 hypothetical protein [Serratia marcescens]MDP8710792.1 hypothetical protein [Serratia marcescens]
MSKTEITTYKGFNQDLTCRGFQFEMGKTFEHKGKVEACSGGFHSCEYPLDCFSYYPPAESRYAETIATGEVSREDGGDSKIASATITIKAEISMHQMVTRAIEWIWSKVDRSLEQTNTGNRSAASNTGYYSAASNTGNRSAASNTGNYSAASNTGDYSAASNTGNRSAASNTGDYSAASNTGNYSAASNTGNYSAASNTGDYSAAEVSGSHSVAAAYGIEGKARAAENSALVLCYRNDEGELIHIRASKVGENGIKPDVWYQLDEDGEFTEVA